MNVYIVLEILEFSCESFAVRRLDGAIFDSFIDFNCFAKNNLINDHLVYTLHCYSDRDDALKKSKSLTDDMIFDCCDDSLPL